MPQARETFPGCCTCVPSNLWETRQQAFSAALPVLAPPVARAWRYEQVRAAPTHFAVCHGHIIPGAERIVEARVGYTIVEKIGAAAEYAASVNPRALIG
jgi:hypothetical protein